MKARQNDKEKAIELRKSGLTYREIRTQIKVSKSLLSGWFKDITLTTEEEEYLRSRTKKIQDQGRVASILSNRNRRINRELRAMEDAKYIFSENKDKTDFLIGITLYWAEGSKRTSCFQFINSDPDMIKFMYGWMEKYLKIEKSKIYCRLFIHKVLGYENIEGFWGNMLGIDPKTFQKTIYKPTIHSIKKNPLYKGCLRLETGGIYELRLMKAWQKLLVQYIVK